VSCLCNQRGRRAGLEGCVEIGMIHEGGMEVEGGSLCIRGLLEGD
jgi:hypothetical protein